MYRAPMNRRYEIGYNMGLPSSEYKATQIYELTLILVSSYFLSAIFSFVISSIFLYIVNKSFTAISLKSLFSHIKIFWGIEFLTVCCYKDF